MLETCSSADAVLFFLEGGLLRYDVDSLINGVTCNFVFTVSVLLNFGIYGCSNHQMQINATCSV
jgi:hypothetical protein